MFEKNKIFGIDIIKLLSIFSLSMSFCFSFADQSTHTSPSPSIPLLNWQKANLESGLKEDLVNNLSAIVGKENFVININVAYKSPTVKPLEPAKKATETKTTPDGSTDDDKELVFLNKIGVQTKIIVETAETPPSLESSKITDSADIFSLIEKVRITCLFDKSISDDRLVVVKKVISNSLIQFDPKKIVLNIDRVSLAPPPKEEKSKVKENQPLAPKEPDPTLLKKMEPFSTPLSILLSFLTVMVMMLIMFKATKASIPSVGTQSNSNATPPPPSNTDSENHNESKSPTSPSVAPVPVSGMDKSSNSNTNLSEEIALTFDKFKFFLKLAPGKCRLILQEWLTTESPLANYSIKALVLYLSLEQFTELSATFTPDQKKKLKKIIATEEENPPPTAEVLSFLRGQLMAAYLSEELALNIKQQSFLTGLTPPELADLANEDIELVSNVVNLLSTEAVAQLFNIIDPDKVSQILQLSSQFKIETFIGKYDIFEQKINRLRESSKVVLAPVLEGADSLLGQVGPDKESILYSSLITSKAFTRVEILSKTYFPSELVLRFAPEQLKSILLKMPITKRAELIYSLAEVDKKSIFVALGETGKMRELIDSEIEAIQTDDVRKKFIDMNKSIILKSFVDLVRLTIKSNPVIQESAASLVKAWIEEKKTSSPTAQAA